MTVEGGKLTITGDALLEAFVAHYADALAHSNSAQKFLRRQGLGDRELQRRLRLGFGDRSFGKER